MARDLVKIAQKQEQSFLIGKHSALQKPSEPKRYYQIRKHSKGVPSMQNLFILDQGSQVNPTILPGVPISLRYKETFRVLAENGFTILTEFGEPIRIE